MRLHYAAPFSAESGDASKQTSRPRIAADQPHRHDQFGHDPRALLRGIRSACLSRTRTGRRDQPSACSAGSTPKTRISSLWRLVSVFTITRARRLRIVLMLRPVSSAIA